MVLPIHCSFATLISCSTDPEFYSSSGMLLPGDIDLLLDCSMVIKIFKPQAAFSAVGYNLNKIAQGKAELMTAVGFDALKHLMDVRTQDYLNYLEVQSSLNKNVKLPQFHAVLSAPDASFDRKALDKLAKQWLKAMGYGGQPCLLVFHKDTDQAHLHIVTTRVGRDGRKIDSGFEHRRAVAELNKLLTLDAAHQAQRDASKALSYACSTKAQVFLLLEGMGYRVKESEGNYVLSKDHKLLFVLRAERVEQKLAAYEPDVQRRAQLKAIFHKYQPEYDTSLVAGNKIFRSDFSQFLHEQFGLELVFHASGDKPPYGYTVIDHSQQRVFKGSELMKLSEMLGTVTEPQALQRTAAEQSAKKLHLNLRFQFSNDVDDQQIHGPRRRRQKKARTNTR